MNQNPIPTIKAELKKNYPGFRFDVKGIPATYSYSITAFKGTDNLSTITIPGDTPMNTVWEKIIAWMRPLLRYYLKG